MATRETPLTSVEHATRLIRDGQRIRVHGTDGSTASGAGNTWFVPIFGRRTSRPVAVSRPRSKR